MKTKEEAYEAWAEKDASRKGVLQREAFMVGWDEATNNCIKVVKTSYILDESEDFKRVVVDNIYNTNNLVIRQADDDWYYRNQYEDK